MREVNIPLVGLLPFYLKLYDDLTPEARPMMQAFTDETAGRLSSVGLNVFTASICRLEDEFRAAVSEIEKAGADAIVTLHLAYSPSLESIDALLSTDLPIIALDITPTYDFTELADSKEIMMNHGIHGVQDMCSMLRRYKRLYWVEAGHMDHCDVLERVVKRARAASAAAAFSRNKIGLIGEPFKGMGDFQVPFDELSATLGVEVAQLTADSARAISSSITDEDVSQEIERYKQIFNVDPGIEDNDFEPTVRACLTVRRWIEQESLTGYSFSFLDITDDCGVETVPFNEASFAMTRGLGYAGEGDVLTSALVAALMHAYRDVTFTEMFCPGWSDDTIFLSHMGEVNLDICDGKPNLTNIDFAYTDISTSPMVAYGKMRAGNAVFVNLAIGPDGYELIVAPVGVLEPSGSKMMEHTTEGWFKPPMPVARFLEKYSYAGGTHHAAIVYDVDAWEIEAFGQSLGFSVTIIG